MTLRATARRRRFLGPARAAVLCVLAMVAGALAFPVLTPAGFAADDAGAEKPPPTSAELEALITRLSGEVSRAGYEPQRKILEEALANTFVMRARLFAKSGQRDAAVDTYGRALSLLPSHPQALVELGFIHLDDGRPEMARSLAETAVAAHGNDGHARLLYGEVLYRGERLEDALEQLRSASRLATIPGLAEKIAKLERELAAERGFDRADSSHFVIRFDGAHDDALGRRLLDVLESEFDSLRAEIEAGTLPPITVILYTSKTFRDTTGSSETVAGLFDGKVRLPVGGVREITSALRRVVRHELTHALLHARGRGRVPRWLHEGIAQLMEPRDVERSREALLRDGNGTASLEPFSYPRAHAFVAWLDRAYSRARLLWLVDLLAEERGEDAAMERAFGVPRAELVEAWTRWAQTGR